MTLTQVIDYEGTIVNDIGQWVAQSNLSNIGFDYSVITVLGGQSSGKSTLLNALFGTNFVVMDSQKGHRQTTKGIWISTDNNRNQHNVILDVEGNDSRERGEDRLTFEYRAALFSLALADAVIVNLWYTSLGSYTASSYGLLKTVMEVNLELFLQQKNPPKTLLIFVVRDWAESMTPMYRVQEAIRTEYIEEIWGSIQKPQELQNAKAEDFFEFTVVGLPHALMLPQEFQASVDSFRKRWSNELRPASYSRKIPADGFGAYCASVWETIVDQSQLNIPTQKEMLANFRCQEIKGSVLVEALPRITRLMQQAQGKELSDIKAPAEDILNSALASYNETASRYEESIFLTIQQELIAVLVAELQQVANSTFLQVQQTLSNSFSETLREKYEHKAADLSLPHSWTSFSSSVRDMMDAYLSDFAAEITGCEVIVKTGENQTKILRFSAQPDALQTSMAKDVERMREVLLELLLSILRRKAEEFFENLEEQLQQRDYSASKFATSTTSILNEAIATLYAEFAPAWEGLNNDENQNFEILCSKVVLQGLRSILEALISNFHLTVIARFEAIFLYDEDEQPRDWLSMSADGLKELFTSSKSTSLALIDDFKNLPLNPQDLKVELEDIDKPLLGELRATSIAQKAVRKMQAYCRDAQTVQSNGGATSWRFVPSWVWFVLLALGWNEFWGILGWIFSSPFTFILLVPTLTLLAILVLLGKTQLLIRAAKTSIGSLRAVVFPLFLTAAAAGIKQLREGAEGARTPQIKEPDREKS